MCTLILQDEKVEHAKTKCALVTEEEKLQFVSTELQVLRKQLEREKATFERAYVFVCAFHNSNTVIVDSCVLFSVYLKQCCICIILHSRHKDKYSSIYLM